MICEAMHWSWGDLMAVPDDVYRVLVDLMDERLERARG